MREHTISYSFLVLLTLANFGNVSSAGFELLGMGQRPIASHRAGSDVNMALGGGGGSSFGSEFGYSQGGDGAAGAGVAGGADGAGGVDSGSGGSDEGIGGFSSGMNSGMSSGGSWGNMRGLGGGFGGGLGGGFGGASVGGSGGGLGSGSASGSSGRSGGGFGGGFGGQGGQDLGPIQGGGGSTSTRGPGIIINTGGGGGGASSSSTSTSTSTSTSNGGSGSGGGGSGGRRRGKTESSEESSGERTTGGRSGGRRGGLLVGLVSRRGSSGGGGLLSSRVGTGLLSGALGAASTGLLLGSLIAGRRGSSRLGGSGGTRVIRILLRRPGGCRSCAVRRRSGRRKRSIEDVLTPLQSKIAHELADSVPDHVKVVRCGRHEIANPGGAKDHFCHPEATWATILRMRPNCVCKPGYLRNSWGECISFAECLHCSDKHHLNMDYHLCESACPVVCNQPVKENCPDVCYKECACRPGYIRAFPHGPCVSIKKCLPGCPSLNQVFSLCGSLCPATCANPAPRRCPNVCAGEGCVCKPGYVIRQYDPLICVRPEQCPGRQKKCPGRHQVYTTCKSRCLATCWDKEPRFCTADCAGSGCVCKPGFVIRQRKPLVCVRRNECPQQSLGPLLQTAFTGQMTPRF